MAHSSIGIDQQSGHDIKQLLAITFKTKQMKYMNRSIIIAVLITTITVGCQKKDYFTNTGKHTPNYQGTALDYLKSKPQMWDSLVKVIRIAGMEDVFKNEKITFFAPADSCIKRTI